MIYKANLNVVGKLSKKFSVWTPSKDKHKKNEVFLADLVMELDCRGWLSEVSDIHSANLKSWEVFEVVLGILPPISTNYLLILTKAGQVLCELSWGEKKASEEDEKSRGNSEHNQLLLWMPPAAATCRFSHHKENKEPEWRLFLGGLNVPSSLLTGFGES